MRKVLCVTGRPARNGPLGQGIALREDIETWRDCNFGVHEKVFIGVRCCSARRCS